MPIRNFPLMPHNKLHQPKPMLCVEIINPANKQSILTWALVDTGANECAVPAQFAHHTMLNHELMAVKPKKILTASGITEGYPHTSTINIYDSNQCKAGKYDLVHTIKNTSINFVPNLKVPLLGVKDFLSEFILTVNFPSQIFSVTRPEKGTGADRIVENFKKTSPCYGVLSDMD